MRQVTVRQGAGDVQVREEDTGKTEKGGGEREREKETIEREAWVRETQVRKTVVSII